MLRKIISSILSVSLILAQPLFAQGAAELNIGKYLNQMPAVRTDSFRPARLRYISYDIKSNDFKLLLDQGDAKLANPLNSSTLKLQDATQELFNYFLIGLSLPNEKFWVNLRPDAPQQIIDPLLEKTDMGKIMLEADLQLKKDTAGLTSPQNPEGKEYWDKLYKKAGELFGTENITIPTITRPWIVPGEVIIRESEDSAYIYKANLKVMLEEDYISHQLSAFSNTVLKYSFNDPRMKELNRYSTQLIKELILPKLTQEINTSKKYAQLRQVFFSLILSRWFKDKYKGKPGQYSSLIDSRNLDKLGSQDPWSKDYYFSEYKKSFQQGEYNLKEQVSTPTGQVIRNYVSGGADMTGRFIEGGFKSIGTSSPIDWQTASLIGISIALIAGGVTVFYKFIKKGVIPTADYIRKFKIIEGGINAALGYADKNMLSADDAILLHKRFRNYQDMGVEEVIEIIEGTIKLLEQPYPKPRNKINQENRERVIAILEESLKAAGSSPLTPQEVAIKDVNAQFDLLNRNPRYKDHPEWININNKYFIYAGFIIDEEKYLDALNSGITRLVTDVAEIKDPELKSALRPLVDGFKNLSKAAAKELGIANKSEAPSAIETARLAGDIQGILKDLYSDFWLKLNVHQKAEMLQSANSFIFDNQDKDIPGLLGTANEIINGWQKKVPNDKEVDAAFNRARLVLDAKAREVGVSSAIVLEDEFKKVKDYALSKFKSLEESPMPTKGTAFERMMAARPHLKLKGGPFTGNISQSNDFPGLMMSIEAALQVAPISFPGQVNLKQLREIRQDLVSVIKPLGIQLQLELFDYINEYVLKNPAAASKLNKILQMMPSEESMFGFPPAERSEVISAVTTDMIAFTDKQKAQDFSAKVDAWKALREFMESSSALTQDLSQNTDSPLLPGGIDFTRINYLTRPMGSFQGLDLRLPLLNKAELEGIDINKELASVEQMINARIDVSTDRLKRLLAAMSQKDAFTSQREIQLLPLLLRLCWLKEEKGAETTPDFRAVLLIADIGLFVEQGTSYPDGKVNFLANY